MSKLVSEKILGVIPHPIPWLFTDVTTEPQQLPWKPDEQTDHILQLIFFVPDYLAMSVYEFKSFFTFYRLFIFSSSDDNVNNDERISSGFDIDVLVLYFNQETASINIYILMNRHQIIKATNEKVKTCSHIIEKVFDKSDISESKRGNFFESIFQKYEENWKIVIKHLANRDCINTEKVKKSYNIVNGYPFAVNFYYSVLEATSILQERTCRYPKLKWTEHVYRKYQPFYKELSTEYEKIDNETL